MTYLVVVNNITSGLFVRGSTAVERSSHGHVGPVPLSFAVRINQVQILVVHAVDHFSLKRHFHVVRMTNGAEVTCCIMGKVYLLSQISVLVMHDYRSYQLLIRLQNSLHSRQL